MAPTADKVWQIRHDRLAGNVEAIAKVVPECEAKFGSGAHQSEECVAAVAAIETASTTTDLALGDMEADVALGAIGVERYLRPIEHHQQLRLFGVQPHEQAIERDEAGAPMEDAIEAGTQFAAAPRGGFGAIRLEVIVKPPDQRTHALLCGAMQIGEAVQLVHQPFCMHPAERVLANCELARVVAHNDHLAQQPVRLDAAP